MKLLARCKKLFEAQHEIVRILVKTKKREDLLNQFEEEVIVMSVDRARFFYDMLLRQSLRIYIAVDRLRNDSAMLNRPFIYNKMNLQKHLIKQTLNIRLNLKKRFKELKPRHELNMVLDKTGRLIKVSELVKINRGLENDDVDSVLSDSLETLRRQVSGVSTALKSMRKHQKKSSVSARKDRERAKAQRAIVLNKMREVEN